MRILLLMLGLNLSVQLHAQIFMAKTCTVSFFSKAAVENIEASNTLARPFLNSATNDVAVKINVKGFKFESSLMEEHFNENYLESEKFPYAQFKGKIQEKIDYAQNGQYPITVKGIFSIHGVEQEQIVSGVLTVSNQTILVQLDFKIKLADYKIDIPKVVNQNIAEEVDVKVKTELAPFKQKS